MRTTDGVGRIVSLNMRVPQFRNDEDWQEYFLEMKRIVNPSKLSQIRIPRGVTRSADGKYYGELQYKRYGCMINDMLKQLRMHRVDYCYLVFVVAELLKYEHDRLRTRYIKDMEDCGYIKVWLA